MTHPDDVKLARELAEVSTAQRDWCQAVRRWQAVLEIGGMDAPARAYMCLAQAHRAEGKLDDAEAVGRQGLTRYPDDVKLARELAEVSTAQRDWCQAVRRWQAVLEIGGMDAPARAYVCLAQAHRAEGKLDDAEAVGRQGLTRYPDDVKLARELAEVSTAQRDWCQAVRRWQAVLEIGGMDAPARAYVCLAQAHRAEGKLDDAEAVGRQGLIRYPDDVKLARQLAELSTAQRDWCQAVRRWQAVLDFYGGRAPPEVHGQLSRALRLADRAAEARAVVHDALTAHPMNMRLLSECALCDNFLDGHESAKDALLDKEQMRVEIIVCVYNALQEVQKCLHSIRRNTTVPYSLTIIDDASELKVNHFLNEFVCDNSHMRLVTNTENCGYTRSANLGLREARSNWAILLNSDTVVTVGWLEGLIECAASGSRIKAVGPLSNAATFQSVPETRHADGDFIINELPQGMTPNDAAEIIRSVSDRAFPRVPMLNGFCTLLNLNALKEVGYLDEENFPIGYGEENDLSLRLITAGYQLAIADHVYVFHTKSASFGHESRKAITARSSKALQRIWPGYSYAYVAEGIESLPCMLQLRDRLRAQLSG